jgi:predicted RecB family nuclease
MKAGAQIIVQGALQVAHWSGRADILRRVQKPSQLGSWSYEVVDTKLARETKGSTVLQICMYSELVAAAQNLEIRRKVPRCVIKVGFTWCDRITLNAFVFQGSHSSSPLSIT